MQYAICILPIPELWLADHVSQCQGIIQSYRQVTPCSGSIKTMNHTGKEGESKQAVGNRRQQQITDKLYCTFVYSRTDKNFEFVQN